MLEPIVSAPVARETIPGFDLAVAQHVARPTPDSGFAVIALPFRDAGKVLGMLVWVVDCCGIVQAAVGAIHFFSCRWRWIAS